MSQGELTIHLWLWHLPHSSQGPCQEAVSLVQTCILGKDFSEEDRKTGGGRIEVRRSRRGSPCLLCTSFGIPSHLLEAVTGYEGSHKCLVETQSSMCQPSQGKRDQIPRTCSPLKSRLSLKSIDIFKFLFINQC